MNSEHLVTKSNHLIEARHRQSLTAREQKIILSAVSMIQPDDDDFKTYEIRVRDFHELLGIEGRENYTQMKEIIKNLMTKVIEIPREKGNGWIICNWASHVEYIEGEGRIEFGFDPKLKPYLLQLKQAFTSYKLSNILSLKSAYAIRLYELVKKWQHLGRWEVTVDQLKEKLGIPEDKYKRYGHFKSRVLTSSIEELNANTDITVSFEEVRKSRKIEKITFSVRGMKTKPDSKPKPSNELEGDLLNELNQLSVGYEINIEGYKKLLTLSYFVFNDNYKEELKKLIKLVNKRIDKNNDVNNPVGLMIYILTEKEKLMKQGYHVQKFDEHELDQSGEVIPKWFEDFKNGKKKEEALINPEEQEDLKAFFEGFRS
ncbi:replication initiation protein [Alkalibacillus salilacus]|uniref:replication initiation protein n=1 Tax=Alkalibacillus salilacus TaxID=284582 RepID=UPI0027D8C258|nr:replication initiation protein [Alkalibacillus salilacus]